MPTDISNLDRCLFDPASGRIFTYLTAGNQCFISGDTVDDLIAAGHVSAQALVLPEQEAIALQRQANRRRYCSGVIEIDQAAYEEALNVLPPERWIRAGSIESFRLSERLIDDLAHFFIKAGERYFTITEAEATTHQQLLLMVEAFITPAPIA